MYVEDFNVNRTRKSRTVPARPPRVLPRPPLGQRLKRSFYDRPTAGVARDLLGTALLRRLAGGWVGGVIVETEAYLPAGDPACHAHRGPTRSNASMFAPPGTLYVYPIHAKYCLNAVTEPAGVGSAVLIRALEPVWGMDLMRLHRGHDDPRRLASGPAMLCQALQVDRGCDGIDLTRPGPLTIVPLPNQEEMTILRTPRIGLRQGTDALLRFVVAGNPFVSRPLP